YTDQVTSAFPVPGVDAVVRHLPSGDGFTMLVHELKLLSAKSKQVVMLWIELPVPGLSNPAVGVNSRSTLAPTDCANVGFVGAPGTRVSMVTGIDRSAVSVPDVAAAWTAMV